MWSAEPREGADGPRRDRLNAGGGVTAVRCVCGLLSRVRGRMARGGTG